PSSIYSYPDHRTLRSFPTRRSSDLSSKTLVNAPCCHFSSSRESLSALEDVSTVTLLAASTDFRTSAAGRGPPIKPAERQASSKRSEEYTSELQSRGHLVCRLLLEKK